MSRVKKELQKEKIRRLIFEMLNEENMMSQMAGSDFGGKPKDTGLEDFQKKIGEDPFQIDKNVSKNISIPSSILQSVDYFGREFKKALFIMCAKSLSQNIGIDTKSSYYAGIDDKVTLSSVSNPMATSEEDFASFAEGQSKLISSTIEFDEFKTTFEYGLKIILDIIDDFDFKIETLTGKSSKYNSGPVNNHGITGYGSRIILKTKKEDYPTFQSLTRELVRDEMKNQIKIKMIESGNNIWDWYFNKFDSLLQPENLENWFEYFYKFWAGRRKDGEGSGMGAFMLDFTVTGGLPYRDEDYESLFGKNISSIHNTALDMQRLLDWSGLLAGGFMLFKIFAKGPRAIAALLLTIATLAFFRSANVIAFTVNESKRLVKTFQAIKDAVEKLNEHVAEELTKDAIFYEILSIRAKEDYTSEIEKFSEEKSKTISQSFKQKMKTIIDNMENSWIEGVEGDEGDYINFGMEEKDVYDSFLSNPDVDSSDMTSLVNKPSDFIDFKVAYDDKATSDAIAAGAYLALFAGDHESLSFSRTNKLLGGGDKINISDSYKGLEDVSIRIIQGIISLHITPLAISASAITNTLPEIRGKVEKMTMDISNKNMLMIPPNLYQEWEETYLRNGIEIEKDNNNLVLTWKVKNG